MCGGSKVFKKFEIFKFSKIQKVQGFQDLQGLRSFHSFHSKFPGKEKGKGTTDGRHGRTPRRGGSEATVPRPSFPIPRVCVYVCVCVCVCVCGLLWEDAVLRHRARAACMRMCVFTCLHILCNMYTSPQRSDCNVNDFLMIFG